MARAATESVAQIVAENKRTSASVNSITSSKLEYLLIHPYLFMRKVKLATTEKLATVPINP